VVPFKPGQSGNPKGRKPGTETRKKKEIREYSQHFLESERYRRSAEQRILTGLAPHLEVLLFHYAYGKPVDVLKLQATVKSSHVGVTLCWPEQMEDERRIYLPHKGSFDNQTPPSTGRELPSAAEPNPSDHAAADLEAEVRRLAAEVQQKLRGST
jgi:hypothetical protein